MSKKSRSSPIRRHSLIRPTIKEYNSKVPTIFKRMLGHVAIFVFAVGGIAIMFVAPLPFLTCRHVEPRQIDCRFQEYIAWVIKHTVISLIGGLVFILFGLLSITGLINSALLIGAWLVEFVLLVGGWGVDRFGLSPEVSAQINRYRQMVRGIAIPPDH